MDIPRWQERPELPEHLDPAQAEVYQESPDRKTDAPKLGGSFLVWRDTDGTGDVWHHLPNGKYKGAVYKPGDFTGPQWAKITA